MHFDIISLIEKGVITILVIMFILGIFGYILSKKL